MTDVNDEFSVPKDYETETILWMWQNCNDGGSGCEPYYKADSKYDVLFVDGNAGGSTATDPLNWLGPFTFVG